MIKTKSLCPVCYKEVEAVITINSNVWITKTCFEHGSFIAMLERDPVWFAYCKDLNCDNIYSGYMIDITNKCNLNCKYCYHKNGNTEMSIFDIMSEVEQHKYLAPFLISGGEPTEHSNIFEVIKQMSTIGETILLTNGIKLSDEVYLDKVIETGLVTNNVLRIALSFHPESNDKDIAFIKLCKKKKLKLLTVMYVIDNLEQIKDVLKLYESYKDTILNIRIKAATKVGNTKINCKRIFVSDMIKHLESFGKVIINKTKSNKVKFASIYFNGLDISLVSWYDKYNIDLNDINCAPYYKAKNGSINNMLTSFILNEGTKYDC
jgi:uncharacterized radical SAM superfamily Fe-S cluster-containing enzyme